MNELLFHLIYPLWRIFDLLSPKQNRYWGFTTHPISKDLFIENQRAIFEEIKHDSSIKKIIFTHSKNFNMKEINATNVCVVEIRSFKGLFLLSQCKVLFLSNSIAMDYSIKWNTKKFSILKMNLKKRIIVNLWHSISVKKLFYTANKEIYKHTSRIKYRTKERLDYTGLISSSEIDSYAMAAMFYPINYQQIWLTGLPRNDFLHKTEAELPPYIRESLNTIRKIKKDKKLIIYAPTYRQITANNTAYYYQFSSNEITLLKKFLLENNAILAFRPHYFNNSKKTFNLNNYFDNEYFFDMSQDIIPEYSALARECDLLITDYSSVYIEAIYLSKPVICFGYDIHSYKESQDGLLYDMELVFPGPIAINVNQLILSMENSIKKDLKEIIKDQAISRKIFFKYNDTNNSKRVVNKVLESI